MNIAGYRFQLLNGPVLNSGPGVLLYQHQETGKFFIRVMRNIRMHRGKHNYPTALKELLRRTKSKVNVYVADVVNDTKAAMHTAARIVRAQLSARGKLYIEQKSYDRSFSKQIMKTTEPFLVWRLVHEKTGAVFYFAAGRSEDPVEKFDQRLRTFNNYVIKGIVNANRIVYRFAKKFYPLDITHWRVEKTENEYQTEQDAQAYIATLSKKDLEESRVVLSRISGMDSLYYRNKILKLQHVNIAEYLA